MSIQSHNTELYTITLQQHHKDSLENNSKFSTRTPPPLSYTSPTSLDAVFSSLPLPSNDFFNDIKPFLQNAAELLVQGQTIAFPTETVYGLGANAKDTDAVSRIYAAKGRPSDNPLIVHIATQEQLVELVKPPISPLAIALIHHFWPGPLSIILPHNSSVSHKVTAGLDTLAIRMPNHAIALALIKQTDRPIAAPSSNLSGKPSPTTAQHVLTDLNGRIPGVVDGLVRIEGGDVIDLNCTFGLESTVVDISHIPVDYDYETLFKRVQNDDNLHQIDNIKQPLIYILRPGAITKTMLEKVVGVGYVEYDPSLLINMESFDEIENEQNDEKSSQNETSQRTKTNPHSTNTPVPKHAQYDTKNHGLQPKSPGMKYTHYAPKAPVYIATNVNVLYETLKTSILNISLEQTNALNSDQNLGPNPTNTTNSKIGLLCTTETSKFLFDSLKSLPNSSQLDLDRIVVKICGSKEDMGTVATKLYGCLRDFDSIDEVGVIFAEIYSHNELGAAIMDRLLKAAGGKLLR